MNMNVEIISKFESALASLVNAFNQNANDYFFTEKELLSFFYHLCGGWGRP